MPASRDELSRNACLMQVDDIHFVEGCPTVPLECDADACVLCSIPHCVEGKCTLAQAKTVEACEALGDPCVRLEQEWEQAFLDSSGCEGGSHDCRPGLTDPCGCPVDVNGPNAELLRAAQAASDAAAAAGCYSCDDACPTGARGCFPHCANGECVSNLCK